MEDGFLEKLNLDEILTEKNKSLIAEDITRGCDRFELKFRIDDCMWKGHFGEITAELEHNKGQEIIRIIMYGSSTDVGDTLLERVKTICDIQKIIEPLSNPK